jgi:hypothetical protein
MMDRTGATLTLGATGVAVLASLLLGAVASSAAPLSIDSGASYLAIAPGPNQAGNNNILTAGLVFEAANPDWNTSLSYDDSLWTPFPGDWMPTGVSPMYLRKEFMLGTPTAGSITGGGADDDAQIWVNGTLVYNDINGLSGLIPGIDILPFLVAGNNLIAIKAHNSFGGGDFFSLSGFADSEPLASSVPEPASLTLVGGGIACAIYRRRRQLLARLRSGDRLGT